MRFKEFLYLFEALAPEVQAVLEKSKFPVAQDLVAQAIKDLNDELDKEGKVITDKATAFKLLRQKLGLEKKPEVPEPTEAVLKPFYKQLIDKQITLPEYKTADYFKNSDPRMLNLVMQELRQIIATEKAELLFTTSPQLVFGGENFSNFDDLTEFAAKIHAIEASHFKTPSGFSEFRDPVAADLRHHGTMLWPPKGTKGNPSKIYIFKGDSFLKCKYFGKGAPWCVTKQPGYYYDYRTGRGQTQFFILDYNKAPDDPARYTNPGISDEPWQSEFVDLNNQPETRDSEGTSFGINGYEGSREYMDYLEKMGVPNPWELMKPDTISHKDREFSNNIQRENNLAWAREQGPQTVSEYLQAQGAYGQHLSEKDFKSLSDKEKYDYMVETGLAPDNLDEAMYLRSLSRKDYKEYLANYADDERNREAAEFFLTMRSGKPPTDEQLEYYGEQIMGNSRFYFPLIGAENEDAEKINYPIEYMKYLKRKGEFDRSHYNVKSVWEKLLFPHIKGQKTPIKAYNYVMSNADTFKDIDEDFIVNLIAHDDFAEMRSRDDERHSYSGLEKHFDDTTTSNYNNLKKMLYKKLDDAAKVRVFKELELYDDEKSAEDDPLPYYHKYIAKSPQNIAKTLINNISELKKVYSLIGNQEWMAELPIYDNLTKEEYEWVMKHIGKKMFSKWQGGFSQEYARKHFTHAQEIEDYVLRTYQKNAGLENLLQYLAGGKNKLPLYDKVAPESMLRMISDSIYNNKFDTLLKYIPKRIIYSPIMMLKFLLDYSRASHMYQNEKKADHIFDYIKKYLSHADSSDYRNLANAIKEDKEAQHVIEKDMYYLANYVKARDEFPELYQAIVPNLSKNLFAQLLSRAPTDYLLQTVTPEWLKGEGKDLAGTAFLSALEKTFEWRTDTGIPELIKSILDNSQPYDKNTIKALLERVSRDSVPYKTGAEIMKSYAEKMPTDKIKDFIISLINLKGKYSLANSDIQEFLVPKIKSMSFDMLADMLNSITSMYWDTVLSMYLQNHDLTDEQFKTLFNQKIDGKDYLDVVWSLRGLFKYDPDKFLTLLADYIKNNPKADKRIMDALIHDAKSEKMKKDEAKNKEDK